MKPYGVLMVPEKAREEFENYAKEHGLSVPEDDGSVLVIGRTDDGEEMCNFPDLVTAKNAAELANMAFAWGRRYQAARPQEPWNSEYQEVELFSKKATDAAADAILGLE